VGTVEIGMWCSCGSLVRSGPACPSCGSHTRRSSTAAAVLLGLTLTGCDLLPKNEPLYGVTVVPVPHSEQTTTDTGDTGDSAE
jgi:hypothetical protein